MSSIRYRLLAHNHDGSLVIEVIGQPLQLIRKPHAVLSDRGLLDGFSNQDAAMIGVIAGMVSANHR